MERKLKHEITTKELQELAHSASKRAIQENFALGLPIVVAEAGAIYRVFPDGKREFVQELEGKPIKPTKRKFNLK